MDAPLDGSWAVDELVVAHAVERGGTHVLTGDREDLERLAAPHPKVWIHPLGTVVSSLIGVAQTFWYLSSNIVLERKRWYAIERACRKYLAHSVSEP
jgi:hypothetical protein